MSPKMKSISSLTTRRSDRARGGTGSYEIRSGPSYASQQYFDGSSTEEVLELRAAGGCNPSSSSFSSGEAEGSSADIIGDWNGTVPRCGSSFLPGVGGRRRERTLSKKDALVATLEIEGVVKESLD